MAFASCTASLSPLLSLNVSVSCAPLSPACSAITRQLPAVYYLLFAVCSDCLRAITFRLRLRVLQKFRPSESVCYSRRTESYSFNGVLLSLWSPIFGGSCSLMDRGRGLSSYCTYVPLRFQFQSPMKEEMMQRVNCSTNQLLPRLRLRTIANTSATIHIHHCCR